jgi:hypothetical protein
MVDSYRWKSTTATWTKGPRGRLMSWRGDGSAKAIKFVADIIPPNPAALQQLGRGDVESCRGPSIVGFGEKSHAGIGRRCSMLF